MTAQLPVAASEAKRIGAVAALTRNDQQGEAMAALTMLHRLLDRHNLRLGEVVERGLTPKPATRPRPGPDPVSPLAPHQRQVRECLAWPEAITAWETEFCTSLAERRAISPKQRAVLGGVLAKVRRFASSDTGED